MSPRPDATAQGAPLLATRSGFTLVELLVVVVISTLVLGAIVQILVSNQRLYTATTEQVLAQQTVRAGVEIVAQELREVSGELGDILSVADAEVQVRTVRRAGIVCAIDSRAPLTVRAQIRGQPFSDGDPVTFFVDNDVDTAADDYWATSSLTSADGTSVCPGAAEIPAQVIQFADPTPSAAAAQVRVGALVRAFETFTYGLITFDGEPYLGRSDADGTETPLVGPVDAGDGVEFVYRDAAGTITSTPADVRIIELTVRSSSQARFANGRVVADSLTRLIHLRN